MNSSGDNSHDVSDVVRGSYDAVILPHLNSIPPRQRAQQNSAPPYIPPRRTMHYRSRHCENYDKGLR